MRAPLKVPEVLVHAHRFEGPPWRMPKIGNDHCRVAGDRNHGVLLVDLALAGPATRVRMNIREHLELLLSTVFPERCIAGCMKCDRTEFVGACIKVVVTDVFRNPCGATTRTAEQKCTTL